MKKTVHKLLPATVSRNTGRKLSTCLRIKDKSKFDHKHDLVYHAKYPNELCDENYIGESGRRINERVNDHNGKDNKLHISERSLQTGDEHLTSSDFSIISKNFSGKSLIITY